MRAREAETLRIAVARRTTGGTVFLNAPRSIRVVHDRTARLRHSIAKAGFDSQFDTMHDTARHSDLMSYGMVLRPSLGD